MALSAVASPEEPPAGFLAEGACPAAARFPGAPRPSGPSALGASKAQSCCWSGPAFSSSSLRAEHCCAALRGDECQKLVSCFQCVRNTRLLPENIRCCLVLTEYFEILRILAQTFLTISPLLVVVVVVVTKILTVIVLVTQITFWWGVRVFSPFSRALCALLLVSTLGRAWCSSSYTEQGLGCLWTRVLVAAAPSRGLT